VSAPCLTLVIATRNRQAALEETLAPLRAQTLPAGEFEVVVVDDGSEPPVTRPEWAGPTLTLLRLENGGRSRARNAGAAVARGDVLAFLDDDITVGASFLACHGEAQRVWPGALVVGAVVLPSPVLAHPFGMFRHRLEQAIVPEAGPTAIRNFCTAANMSIPRATFQRLEGFDPSLASGEDQDLALRHTASGGRIVYVPGAHGVHRDRALDIRTYCTRVESGAESLVAFVRRHPDWPDNREREHINGRVRLGREPWRDTARKLAKQVLASRPATAGLLASARVLEAVAPNGRALPRVYRTLVGAYLFRGYRRGLGALSDERPR
jgi:glycosyl transferase family 2